MFCFSSFCANTFACYVLSLSLSLSLRLLSSPISPIHFLRSPSLSLPPLLPLCAPINFLRSLSLSAFLPSCLSVCFPTHNLLHLYSCLVFVMSSYVSLFISFFLHLFILSAPIFHPSFSIFPPAFLQSCKRQTFMHETITYHVWHFLTFNIFIIIIKIINLSGRSL